MKYGKEEVTRTIDAVGSTETISTNYVAGTPVQPVRRLYQMRHRVGSVEDLEMRAIKFLSDAIQPGSKMLEPSIRIEQTPINRKENSHDLVECYTILEY